MAYAVSDQLPANGSFSYAPEAADVGAVAGPSLGRKSSTMHSLVTPFSSYPAPVSTFPTGQVAVAL
ncbi:hypothetical protein ACFYPH_04130 [Micromonospora sp. NPDC005252]|uniref:hypothetical protein n=1 Tax=Micromonospora sp. NPDC005252 TaxID=3364228 RepID=UPI00367FA7DE